MTITDKNKRITSSVLGPAVAFVLGVGMTASAVAQPEIRPGGSADVHYTFPSDPGRLSVSRNGENTFALKIPTFPAYVSPSVSAVYNSRGADGVLGIGWELGFPSITLDFSETRDALDSPATDQVREHGGEFLIKHRWRSHPGGPLLCSHARKSSVLDDYRCHNDPHGPIRFTPFGTGMAQRWIAQDPLEAITQEYGNDEASRIYHGNQVVNWLISRQVSSAGKEVRYFYEERAASQQRLLRAILMGGNKTILFDYIPRLSNINSSFELGTERRSEWLLNEIVLRRACVPVQRIDGRDDVWVDFSNCASGAPVEKIKLGYRQPSQGYTGRYALRSWQHMSGDETVSYRAVEFDYRGDGVSARNNGISTDTIVNPTATRLDVPDGYGLITNSGYAPFQNYADWNRDGLADWISVKDDADDFWPDWDTDQHQIRVRLRNAAREFDPPITYDEPLATYTAWIGSGISGFHRTLYTTARDARGSPAVSVPVVDMAQQVAQHRPGATIGINVGPWMYDPDDAESRPLFKSLSMTVPCRKLPADICDVVRDTYEEVWSRVVNLTYDEIGVKLTDFHDFNGDGYLDRSLSGLLVTWDPTAPDADDNGFRNPATGDPAIYVSVFDPVENRFRPFVRYDIAPPNGRFAGLAPAFLSALAINHKWNSSVSSGDMSGQTVARSLVTTAGVGATLVSLNSAFNPKHAAANPPTTSADRFAGGFNKVDSVLDGAFMAANLAVSATNAPPEVVTGLAAAQLVHGGVSGVYTAAEGVRVATDAASTTAEVAGGWASVGNAVFAVAAQAINFAWRERSRKRMEAPGYNAGAIASNTKTGTAVVSIVAATAGLAITILAAAGVIAVAGGPPGIIIGAILAVISIAVSAWQLIGPEGNFSSRDGRVYYQTQAQRGVWYTNDSVVNPVQSQLEHESKAFDVLDWFDIDGDRRLDLVVSKFDPDEAGFAVSPGAMSESFNAPRSRPWLAWTFPVGTPGIPPSSIRESVVKTEYEGGDSQRADLVDGTVGFVDINGDGLADLVDARGSAFNGIYAFLNNGRSFARETTFPIANATLPNGCTSAFMLSRSRSLAWSEFLGTTNGYGVALSNTTQLLGPDLDNNGLPDLVIKDETRYPSVSAGGNCVKQPTANMCADPLPVDPEPERSGQNNCTDGAEAWYAQFDGPGNTTGQGEGTSHLSTAARDVYDPSVEGTHYVAFNTGAGFTPFVEIEQALPSFGGGLSVVSVTNTDNDLPAPAISGSTNILGDPDADGILHLMAMDVGDAGLLQTRGTHPMLAPVRLGMRNPDVLTRIRYPEGGTVTFDYALEKDVQGLQGPPLWVLSRAEFDDGIVDHLGGLESWNVARSRIEYDYAGAKLGYREFLGFEAVAETRFDGGSLTQVLEVYDQDGPARGTVTCTETRGFAIDNATLGKPDRPEQAICLADDDAGRKVPLRLPKSQFTGVRDSCFDGASARLAQALLPLQSRTEYTYDTAYSETTSTAAGDVEEIRRAFVNDAITTRTWNGTERFARMDVEVEHDPFPWRMPVRSTGRTSDGLVRSQETEWRYETDHWLFLKASERKRRADGSVQLETVYAHQPDYPFYVSAIRQSDGASTRQRAFSNYDSGGLPGKIDDNGVVTNYQYFDDNVPGTGLLRRSRRSRDAFQTADTVHRYRYDVMGRIVQQVLPGGVVSRFNYDPLGLLRWDEPAGVSRRNYRYADVASLGVGRDPGDLGGYQRSLRIDSIENQLTINVWWLDGFGRQWREGRFVEGGRDVAMDFDSDGEIDHVVEYDGDREWLQSRNADYLLRDYRLDGQGRRQCRSLPYVDGDEPESWSTLLHDALQRPAFSRDMTGYGTFHAYAVDDDERVTQTRINDDGHFIRETLDGFGRVIENNNNDLLVETYRHHDWGGRSRRTDGRGFHQIWEINGWSEPVKICHQVDPGPAPASDVCPTDWATRTLSYNARGLIDESTDPMGHVTSIDYGQCDKPVRIETPAFSADDPRRRPVTQVLFDGACRDVRITNPLGHVTRSRYDTAGRLVQLVEAVGTPEEATATLGYDALGRQSWIADFDGRRQYAIADFRDLLTERWFSPDRHTEVAYGVRGNVVSKTAAEGQTVHYESDRMNRLERASWEAETCDMNALDNGSFGFELRTVEHRYVHDAKGRLIDEYDANGHRNHYAYDAADRLTRVYATDLSDPAQFDAGAYREFLYDAAGQLRRSTSAGGLASAFDHNGLGFVTAARQVAPSGAVIESQAAYDLNGNLREMVSPAGIHGSTCDIADTDRSSYTSHFDYAPSGLPTRIESVKDHNGNRRHIDFDYNLVGQLETVRDQYDQSQSTEYDERLRVRRVIDALGNSTQWQYDANNRITLVTDPLGREHRFSYDEYGQRVGGTDGRGYGRFNLFDADGRHQVAAGEVDTQASSWSGKAIEYTVDGRVKRFRQLSLVGTPDPQTNWQQHEGLTMCHDPTGRPIAWRDDAGHVVQSRFDPRGRKVADLLRRTPAGAWVGHTYKYNDDDLLVVAARALDGNGGTSRFIETAFHYDEFNRLVREVGPEPDHVVEYAYDVEDQLCTRVEYHANEWLLESSFTYAPDGGTVEQAHRGGDVSATVDAYGNLQAESNDHASWDYEYDARGRITRQTQVIDGVVGSFDTGYQHDARGRVDRIALPDVAGLTQAPDEVVFEYTDDGFVSSVHVDNTLLFSEPVYDGKGRLVQWALGDQLDHLLVYDANDRLAQMQVSRNGASLVSRSYQYDGAGNVSFIDDQLDNQFDLAVQSDALNRIVSQSSAALGGLIQYAWNDQNLPMEISGPAGHLVTFTYGDDATLIERASASEVEVYKHNALYQRQAAEKSGLEYHYNDDGQIREIYRGGERIEEILHAADGRRVRHNDRAYLYGSGHLPIVEMSVNGAGVPTGAVYNFALGTSLAMTVDAGSGDIRYFATDAMDAPILETDGAGNVLATRQFGAFGEALAGTGTFSTDIGYQGNYRLGDSDLYLMHYRAYDPRTLSFTSIDPLGISSTGYRYDFAGANPLVLHDRSGLQPEEDPPLELNWLDTPQPEHGSVFVWDSSAPPQGTTRVLPNLMFETSVYLGVDPAFNDPRHAERLRAITETERIYQDGNMSVTLRDFVIKNELEPMLGSRANADQFLATYDSVVEGDGYIYKGQGHIAKFNRREWSFFTPGTVAHRINVVDMANSGRIEMQKALSAKEEWFPVVSENDLLVMRQAQTVYDIANASVAAGEIIVTAPVGAASAGRTAVQGYRASKFNNVSTATSALDGMVAGARQLFWGGSGNAGNGPSGKTLAYRAKQFDPELDGVKTVLTRPHDRAGVDILEWARGQNKMPYDPSQPRPFHMFFHGSRKYQEPRIPDVASLVMDERGAIQSVMPASRRNVSISPLQLAQRMRMAGLQPGQPVNLVTCHVGANTRYMQELSRLLPTNAISAGTDKVAMDSVGQYRFVDWTYFGGRERIFLGGRELP